MTSDLVPQQQSQVPATIPTVLGVSPQILMEQAVEIANVLARVLREKGLTQRFGQGEHVKVEGWQLAGSLLGFVSKEKEVKELSDGSFESLVALIQAGTGRELADASGYCGTDEPNWRSKPKYARRSMAITRGISRVYANNFRWIIKLAGFETTPAEEMDGIVVKQAFRPEGYDEGRKAMAAEIKREAKGREETLEIPFGAHGSDEVYTATLVQKRLLAADAKRHGIVDGPTLKEISETCQAQNVFVADLPAAVKQWVDEQR